jgi:glycosyltransferase involved in cell wall biosynthesis
MAPDFRVLTTCHNDGAYLPDAIASLRAQTVAGWEHVVVLNGCTDDSDRVALAWQANAPAPVVVLWQAHVTPQPVALNLAARAARGDWLVWLNADDMLAPGALEATARVIDAAPDVNCIVSPWQFFGGRTDVYTPAPCTGDARMVTEHQVPGIRAVRRDLWDALGGEDEAIPVGADWDWACRAVARGLLRLHVHPTPLWHVRHHGDAQRTRLTAQADYPTLRAHMARHFETAGAC